MTYLLYILFALSCIVLIISILLQPGKADAGALFTNSVSSTAFGPRGTATLLSKITIGAAIAFMLLAFTLSLPLFGTRSVLDTQGAPTAATPAPISSPQASPATAATPQNTAAPMANNTDAKTQPTPSKEQKK